VDQVLRVYQKWADATISMLKWVLGNKWEISIMNDNANEHILILTGLTDQPEAERAERGAGDRVLKRIVNTVSVSALKENMQAFYRQLQEIIGPGKEKIGAFELSQIEVTAQITGDGKVCLLGSGAKIEVQGGIKFILKRTTG
jgi:hypothetical protein